MSMPKIFPSAAVALLLGVISPPAFAQGFGYGLGEWDLITQGGASVCHVVLTNRPIPEQASWRAFVRGGPRCTDWRARSLVMWSVRGNRMGLADGTGRAIADIDEQNPNLYAAGEWQLVRRGTGAYQQPPAPGLAPGQLVGEWDFIAQDTGSVCWVTLTNRIARGIGAYRAITRGGPRCVDARGQNVAYWSLQGGTVYLTDAGGKELGKMDVQGPHDFAGGGQALHRRGY